jgi:hypothetical protein
MIQLFIVSLCIQFVLTLVFFVFLFSFLSIQKVMIPISLGNHPTRRDPGRLLVSSLLTLVVTV